MEIMQTINGLDLIAFALGGLVMAVVYEVLCHQMRKRFDRRLDATWDRAYDEGWHAGARGARSLDRAVASVMEGAEVRDE